MHDIRVTRKDDGSAEFRKIIIIEPRDEKQEIVPEKAPGCSHVHMEFICIDRFSVVSAAGEPYMLREGDSLEFSKRQDEEIEISCIGEGRLALICTYYNEETGTEEAEETILTSADTNVQAREATPQAKEKSFASDIGIAYKIALTRFRGSSLIVRSLRKVWFDRELQRSIAKVENAYLPYILIIVGLTVIGLAGAGKIENNTLFIIMGVWLALAVFVIIPLIFYAVLPKPAACHIKKTDELCPEDRQMYEEDLKENRKANKLVKRYAASEKKDRKTK